MTDFQQWDLASARILSPAAGHEAEERQFPFPFFTSQRDAPQLRPFRRPGRMHPSWAGAGRPVHRLAGVLSHHPLGNMLKIHLLSIMWIWNFPQEGLYGCSGPAAARLSPRARCGGGGRGGGGRQVQVLGSRRHSRVRRAGSEQRWPPALTSAQPAKTTRPSKLRATASLARWRAAS